MKALGFLIIFVVALDFCYAQQLHLKKYDGNTINIELKEIDSLMFQRNKIPQNISSPDTVVFENLNCDKSFTDTVLSIINPGDKALMVTHVDLSSKSDFRFLVEPPTVFSIEPHQKFNFKIRFEPTVARELRSAVLTITSNAQKGVYHKIYLLGKKDSLDFKLSKTELNLGNVCYNSYIDTSISIINTGEGTIRIVVSTTDDDNNPVQNIILNTGEQKDVHFRIHTGFETGIKDFRVICTDNCGNEKSFIAKFNVTKPNVVIENAYFTAKIGESAVANVKLHNNSDEEITIESIDIDDNQFVLLTNTLPIKVPASGVNEFQVRYTPVNDETVIANITFSGQPCGFNFSGKLTGETVKKIYLLNEDFEKYPVNEFPDEGGWVFCYGIDSLGYVVDSTAKNGKKSLYIIGVSQPEIKSYYLKHRLENVPDKIFVEAWIMIERGHAGSGIYIGSKDVMSCYASLQYGNHSHYFSSLGQQDGIWPEKPEHYVYGLFQWNKLSFQFDKKNKTQNVYINDYLVLSETCPTCNFNPVESVFLYASETGAFIDDVKVWYYEDEQ